ncbi:MAG: cytidylate kinase-like family protein [Lachnospiraceae bacterium]|nr:cytidylate kinase-like family protein [Lachnospiraceae bacterium]
MRIITIEREFGSGGRELGKRLAGSMEIPCYDQELIDEVAKLHNLSPEYIERISESDIRTVYPRTIGHRFSSMRAISNDSIKVAASQKKVIERLASQGDCVLVGRGADVILKEYRPFRIFVYADQVSKINRCLARSEKGENEKEIQRQMKYIDKNREIYHDLLSDTKWGDKENYHLCINTSGRTIKSLIPGLTAYIYDWFQNQ